MAENLKNILDFYFKDWRKFLKNFRNFLFDKLLKTFMKLNYASVEKESFSDR
jgi:hypothetical protein